MKREARLESFDGHTLPAPSTEVLDFLVASELVAPTKKLKSADLERLKITVACRMNAPADQGTVRATGTSTNDPMRTYTLA
jgi:hypothetical protein